MVAKVSKVTVLGIFDPV